MRTDFVLDSLEQALFRLSINGLAVLVEQGLDLNPVASCAYFFSNRQRDQVKILGWERNGLLYSIRCL